VEGEAGDFSAKVRRQPRYVDENLCTACGTCSNYCPAPRPDLHNEGLSQSRAIHIEYPQGIPAAFQVDESVCLYLTKRECKQCERVCLQRAIDFKQRAEDLILKVGAVILSPGAGDVSPEVLERFGHGVSPNIVTSREFERILSASGPFGGHLVRPSDHMEPKSIAWLQCIGSRDMHADSNAYCSSVCCTYAIKQAVLAKEHAKEALEADIFYIDIRTTGKDFERYYTDARDRSGVRFIKGRISSVSPDEDTGHLLIWYVDGQGRKVQAAYDMVVLSAGMRVPPDTLELAQRLDIDLTEGRFCRSRSFAPGSTSREGIYGAGVFQGPKDIPQVVIEASSSAAAASGLISAARNTLTVSKGTPREAEIAQKVPQIGVFLCHCGINISSVIDMRALCEHARTLPFVVYATDTVYACSQDAQGLMAKVIREQHLNRVVVAACSPKTHEPLFQETLLDSGLNKYLFEMANIRNHDSWVHRDDPRAATEKAKDLVRMAVTKAALLQPLLEERVSINQNALVLGGGISGMAAAKAFSMHGYHVDLLERAGSLGGQAKSLYRTWLGEDVQKELGDLIRSVKSDRNIDIHLDAQLTQVEGYVGNFRSRFVRSGQEISVEHGVTVIATGAAEWKPQEYLYGKDPRVVTHQELDRGFIEAAASLKKLKRAVFIQCVGSREPQRPYCSRLCCTHSMVSALKLKEINPEMEVWVLYRDMRTYGEREQLYRKARSEGVSFVRYLVDRKPRVAARPEALDIEVYDLMLQRSLRLNADLLVLASAVVPYRDDQLARLFKIPMNEDGFFMEAHAKLRPSEFATDGVFLCGLAHYPKPVDEAVTQAQAASSRAMTLLARKEIPAGGIVAHATPALCTGCGVCVEICPYSAPSIIQKGPGAGKAEINPVLCKGCGLCISSCRSGAIDLKGFEERQLMAMMDAM
jgi:heterodisulfide reductase subunit A